MKLRRRVVATGFKTFEFETKLTESERSRRAWMRVTGRGELNCKVSPRDEKESRKAPAGKREQSGGIWRLRPHFYSLSNWSVRFLETFVCIKTEDLGLGIPEEEKSSGWAIFQEALTILDLDLSTSAGGEEQSGGIWKLRPHFYSPSNWSVRFLETFVCIKTEDLGLGIPEEEKKLRLGNLPGGLNRS
uniref:Uncharacterized protein n=1 Tax=Nelumbo nucifera TaxID=4432 RepID=A0A822XTK5_NELNU|nr:TPA_asm: hypothetical protein HUJ06_023689 [Nelumbo nucifera]